MNHLITSLVHRYEARTRLSAATVALLQQVSRTVTLLKNDKLIEAGTYAQYVYFLVKGTIRSYYLKDGTEVNTWFAFDGELVGSFDTYLLQQAAPETVEALEPCELLALDIQLLKKELLVNLEVSNLVRVMIEEYAAFLQARINALQFQTAEQRYSWLLQYEPETLQRVSLTHIASYLGVSRETLSRMRGKK